MQFEYFQPLRFTIHHVHLSSIIFKERQKHEKTTLSLTFFKMILIAGEGGAKITGCKSFSDSYSMGGVHFAFDVNKVV